MRIIHERRWTKQPTGLFTIDRSHPLSRSVTHLYTPTRRANVAGQAAVVGTSNTTFESVYRNGVLWDRTATSSNKANYLPQSSAQVNLGLPWTIAILGAVDPNIGNIDSLGVGGVVTSNTAGASGSVFDRGLGFGFSSPLITVMGSLYDGGSKTVTHQVGLAYQSGFVPFTAVVSASNGFLRVFVNGISCTTETAVSNNGYTGYSGQLYLNWGNLTADPGYHIGLVLRADGFAWQSGEARAFHQNPWQMFAPLRRRIYLPAAAGGATITGPLVGGSHLLTNGPLVSGRLRA